jgi:hypothetical protein
MAMAATGRATPTGIATVAAASLDVPAADAGRLLTGRRRIYEAIIPLEGKRALLHRISAFVPRFGICHKAA